MMMATYRGNDEAAGTEDMLNKTMSRRKLLASLGAGAALVSTGLYGFQGRAEGKANPQVLFSNYANCMAASIAELRAEANIQPDTIYYVVDPGQEGPFICDPGDTSSVDNTGTVLVTAAGDRMKRIYDGFVNVRWFGAKGDGAANDTAAIQAAIQACYQHGGGAVYLPQGVYVCTNTITVPSGVVLEGAGLDEWVPSAQNIVKGVDRGTHLMFSGAGPKSHSLYGITDMSLGGGVRQNPDQPGQSYKLASFYLNNAAGNNPASPRMFSAAVVIEDATQSGISNLRIMHSYNGVQGFNLAGNRGFGDEWDIGLWVKNSSQGRYDRVQVVGYWRMYGVLVSSMNEPQQPSMVPTAESNRFEQCVMSGKSGLGFRSGDVYRCLGSDSSTVSIAWSPSNPFPSGGGSFRVGANSYAYTGTTRVNDQTLRFDGVSPNPSSAGISAGNEVRTSTSNFGFAGTVISDCYISGFDHSSGVMCTNSSLDAPFDSSSACVEISGEPVRGLHFLNCTIQTRDEVLLHLHDARDIEFVGCYFESKSSRSSVGTSFNYPAGARFIASPFLNNSTAPYPSGESNDIKFYGCSGTDSVICRQPLFKRTGSTKFSAGSGLFNPRGYVDDTMTGGSIQSSYPIKLPKSTPLMIYDYEGNQVGMFGYNETGELDMRSGGGNVRLRRDSVTRMLLTASEVQMYGTARPNADNTLSLGTSSHRWKDIYAANGTINTSDANEKENVQALQLGLDFIERLRPVSYKFKNQRQTVQDDEGNEQMIEHQFARPHFGLIAQEVKEVLDGFGMDAGAYVYDPDSNLHGLRYNEFIPVMIKALQELKSEVDQLKAKLHTTS